MGEIIALGDLVTFSAGTNLTRLNDDVSNNNIYTLEDFDSDLCSLSKEYVADGTSATKEKGFISVAGDVVISMTRSQAGIVSPENSGKYLNSNFVKCEFDRNKLYPWYFCYLLNESTTVSQQIKKLQQGTIGCINRLTISMIGSLLFELVELSRQRTVGDLYRNMLIQEHLTLKQMENMRRYTLEIIKKTDKN